MDEGILQEFLAESFENLAQVEQDLVVLERAPDDLERLANAFRAIHTVKGTCGFFGFSKLGTLAHLGENLLGRLRAGEVALTREMADALLALVDAVRLVLNRIASEHEEGSDDFGPLIATLSRLQSSGDERDGGNDATGEGVVAAPHADAAGHAHAEGSIRVDVQLLDLLMNLVGELVLARNQLMQKVASSEIADLPGTTQRLNLITTELQEGIMKTRMQPIASLCNKLPRLVRDVSTECGKEVRLELEGVDTELDRTIIDSIRDPITHLIRNAIDHGIEPPETRVARGKPREGLVRIRAFHEGGKVNVEVSDDGAGFSIERIREKALRENLVPAERAARLTDREWAQVVFLPGFSTARVVSSVSGRGVGMDVVKTNVERIGGAIDVDSKPGEGATVRIRIPLTLAIVPALIVRAAGERYAIPQINLIELVRVEADRAGGSIAAVHDTPVLRYRGGLLPLVDLRETLGVPDRGVARPADRSIVVLHADAASFGLIVDAIDASQEIVVKSLGESLRAITVFAGATILGDGTVSLILDVPGLARHAGITLRPERREAAPEPVSGAPAAAAAPRTLILCRVGSDWPIAIPQESIVRLEEFPRGHVERVGGRDFVQYRGGILPLVGLAGLLGADAGRGPRVPDAGSVAHVVVCERSGRSVGLVVEEIAEIVDERVAARLDGARRGLAGTAVVRGRVTDLVDVPEVLSMAGETRPDAATGGTEGGA